MEGIHNEDGAVGVLVARDEVVGHTVGVLERAMQEEPDLVGRQHPAVWKG